jgi:DnaJ-class molecular chaperone
VASTPTPKAGELNEFQAAALVGLSPRLLRWLSGHAPKVDNVRKLKVRKSGDTLFFDQKELVGFNDWLRLPWPHKPGSRPPIPAGIRREIREEASGQCAMCNTNADACEAAHIEPVAKSKNNHPENLIWLCASHHTKFDNGNLGPKPEDTEFVVGFKQVRTYYWRAVWQLQADVTGALFTTLKACESLDAQLAAATTQPQVAAVSALAKTMLKQVPKMAPTSKADPAYAAFTAMKPQFAALSKSSTKPKDLQATLKLASSVKADFAKRAGYVDCPLCEGSGSFKHDDCPACGGEAELTEAEAREVDLARYTDVTCPLCDGARSFKGHDCPACGGEGEMEQRYADQVDPGEWAEVECPVCDGSGRLRGEDCPGCGGDRTLERHQRDQLDLREYALVDCPLCDGRGTFRGEDCPECGGERQIERRHADQVDLRQYQEIDCPICAGSRNWRGDPCRACNGEGQLDRHQADQIDRRDYQMVDCPSCTRQDREYCGTCGGEGRVPRWVVDQA